MTMLMPRLPAERGCDWRGIGDGMGYPCPSASSAKPILDKPANALCGSARFLPMLSNDL